MDAEAMVTEDSPEEKRAQRIRDRETLKLFAAARQWWRRTFVSTVDQLDVIRRIKEECDLTGRYVFMISMSAGIAVLGLILASPAVVIGAMLLSPLMGPIIGAGFALAIWDVKWLRESGKALFIGTVASILIAALITWMSPIQTVTAEIASRTKPSLLDLGVALFSALAGAYAMVRGRAGTIVGVAIAVALMPPLAVVGFGLATANWTVFGGALMLFITNLVTITAGAAGMARIYGFRSNLSKQRSLAQSLAILLVLVLLAIPLTISLLSIASETRTTTVARNSIERQFSGVGYIAEFDVDVSAEPITVRAVVNTTSYRPDAETAVEQRLSEVTGLPVDVTLNQLIVDSAEQAQQDQIAAARTREQAELAEQRIDLLRRELALVTGRKPQDITIDRDNRRAMVRALPLEGASLAAYRELEGRISASAPEWDVRISPPARPLPFIASDGEGNLDPAALALVAWAGQRIDAPISLSGNPAAVEQARAMLANAGVEQIRVDTESGNNDGVRAAWATPGS